MDDDDRVLLLLGLLRREAMHGYQLHDFIERNLASCTDLKKPTAYLLLAKMARAGLVTQKAGRTGKRPPRRVYSITPKGEEMYQRLLRANLAAHQAVRFPGEIGLVFLDDLPPAEAAALLAARRAALAAALDTLRAVPPHSGGPQRVVEHQRQWLRQELRWLDGLLKQLPERA